MRHQLDNHVSVPVRPFCQTFRYQRPQGLTEKRPFVGSSNLLTICQSVVRSHLATVLCATQRVYGRAVVDDQEKRGSRTPRERQYGLQNSLGPHQDDLGVVPESWVQGWLRPNLETACCVGVNPWTEDHQRIAALAPVCRLPPTWRAISSALQLQFGLTRRYTNCTTRV